MNSKTKIKPFGGNLNIVENTGKNNYHSVLGIFDDQEMHQGNLHLRGDGNFSGPVDHRKCTNIFFLAVFLCMSGLFVVLSVFTIQEGDPARLSQGYDLRSEICGLDDLSDKRFMLYPDPTNLDWTLCIEACPYYYLERHYCIYDTDHYTMLTEWGCSSAYATTAYGFYCIPAESSARKDVFDILLSPMQLFRQWTGDVVLLWDLILLGQAGSAMLGIIFMILFKYSKSVKHLVKYSVIAVIVLKGFLIYLLVEAGYKIHRVICEEYGPAEPEYCDTRFERSYYGGAIGVSALLLIYMIRAVRMRKHMEVALEMIKLTKRPLKALKGIYSFTGIQVVLGGGFTCLLVVFFCYSLSMGGIGIVYNEKTPGGAAKHIQYNETERLLFVFSVMMSFWWLVFLIHLGKYTIAGGVSTWFFTRHKFSMYKPFTRAFNRAWKYHAGSIAIDTIMRPFLYFPVLIISYFHRRIMRSRAPMTRFGSLMLRLFVCIKFYEKWLRFFTSHTYIMISIFGEEFWGASKQTFFLSQRNRLRIEKPDKMTDFYLTSMAWAIALFGACISFGWVILREESLTGQQTIEIVNPIGPLCCSLLLCWYTGKVYAGAIQITVKTLLFSAVCDEEMFTREQRYCEEDMINYLDGIGEEQNEFHRDDHVKVVVDKRDEDSTLMPDSGVNTSRAPIIPLAISSLDEEDPEIVLPGSRGSESRSSVHSHMRLSPHPPPSSNSNRSIFSREVSTHQNNNSRQSAASENRSLPHSRIERPIVFMQTIEEEESINDNTPRARVGRQARFVDN